MTRKTKLQFGKSDRVKYYIRRLIVTGLIASPCYIFSKVFVLLALVGLAYLPDGFIPSWFWDDVDLVAWFVILTWGLVLVLGWFGSKLLVVIPLTMKYLEKST